MTLDKSLARVQHDLETGDLGKARDRLEGLLVGYPDHVELRARLGEIYWRLLLPVEAGRCWYLEPNKSPEMLRAVAAFEARHGGDPGKIARALHLRVEPESLPAGSREIALELLARAGPLAPGRATGRSGNRTGPGPVQARVVQIGCMVLLALGAISSLVGLLTMARLISNALR